jgi:flagellar basal-body rod protein FlgF
LPDEGSPNDEDLVSIDPIRRTAQALRHWEIRHQAMSNNLSNTGTTGFKAERVFGELLQGQALQTNSGTDFSQGALTQTDRPLDVAIGGEGFLVIRTSVGERLVRGGSFEVDSKSRIVDAQGNELLGERGTLVIPPGEVTIDRAGQGHVDGALLDRLKVVTLRSYDGMQHEAGGRFRVPEDQIRPLKPEDSEIRQGFVEESNQGAVEGMIEMIQVQRAHAAVERALEALDGALRTVVNEIGRPV